MASTVYLTYYTLSLETLTDKYSGYLNDKLKSNTYIDIIWHKNYHMLFKILELVIKMQTIGNNAPSTHAVLRRARLRRPVSELFAHTH